MATSSAIYKGKREGQRNMYFPTMTDTQQGTVPKVNLNEVTVLPRAEWERIKDQLSDEPLAEKKAKAEAAEKKRIAAESKKLVATWTNTIAGQRIKKLEAGKLREAREEEERKIMDLEEAKYQAEKRKETLDEAKKLQYWKTDRVKSLHSALTLTEVIREREEQLKLKARIHSAQTDLDAQLMKKYEEENQAAMLKEKREAFERYQDALKNNKDVVHQIKHRQTEKNREKLRDKMEGIEIQDALRQYEDETLRVAKIKEEEKKTMLRAHEETLANKNLIQAIERQNEEEADERIRRFAMAKREMARLRKDREKQMLSEKLRIRDQQTEKLGNLLRQMKNSEEERMMNALQEKEAKEAKDEAEKQRAQQEMFDSINNHRNETMKQRQEREKAEKLEAMEMRQARLMADELFMEHENKKAAERFNNTKALKQIHLAQKDEKYGKLKAAKDEELNSDAKTLELQRLEAIQFADYAKEVIEEEKDRGATNLYPLIKVANSGYGGGKGPAFDNDGTLRPSYMTSDKDGAEMPSFQSSGAVDTKKGQSNNTAKRLGFCYKA